MTSKILPFLFIIVLAIVFIPPANALNVTIGNITINGTDTYYGANFSSVSIPTNIVPITYLFISNQDTGYQKDLSSISIPTNKVPITYLFISNQDDAYQKDLSSVSIPTNKVPITNLFISNQDTDYHQGLSSVSIPTNSIPIQNIFISNADVIFKENLVSKEGANQPPIASLSHSPKNPIANQTVIFDASNSTDPNGTITNYEWIFGDATTGFGKVITHSYAENGSYTVKLTVTDDKGATNTTLKEITIGTISVEEEYSDLVKFTSNATTFYSGYTDKWFNPNWWYDLRDDVDRQATYRAALGDFVNSPLTSVAGLMIGDTVLGAVNSILGLFSYFMQFVDAFFSFIAVETYDAAGLIVAQAPNFQYIHQDLNNLIINEAAIEEAISVGDEGRLEDLLEGRKAILEELYSKLDDYDASIYNFTIDHALDHNYSTGKWGYGYALIKDFTIGLHLELQGDYIYTTYQLNRIHGSNDFEKLNEVVKDGYIRPTRYDIGPYSSHIIGCLDDMGGEAKFVINLRPEEIEGDRGLVILEAKNEGMMLYLERSLSNDKWSGRDIKITDPTPGIYNLTVNATKNPGLYHLVAYTKDFNPLHFESDIASVNITPVGVEVQYPRPKVVAIQVNKNETSLNEEVILTVNVTNDRDTANWQSIAVSSPDIINVDSYTILSHNLDYFEKYDVGYETGCDYGNDTKTLTYPLIEGAKNDWVKGFNGELKLKIKPEKEGILRIYAKSVAYGSGVWRSAPKIFETSTKTKDQQNEYVYVKSIVVTNEEKAPEGE